MSKIQKLTPIEAAEHFINKHHPNCQAALLAGSVIRGEATETSDLDIIVFDKDIHSSYRESLVDFGWAIEVFVHNVTSYKQIFESDYKRARPSMPRMVSEGVILKDEDIISSIKKEATELLKKGPEEWSKETINIKRYFITDALDDFIGCTNREEDIFIANTLTQLLSEFVLRTNRQWIGASKWVIRSLRTYDEDFANQFVEAFDTFYRTSNKDQIVKLTETILQPHGGKLFAGFTIGKQGDGSFASKSIQ
ncbi:nucleotidyltransferase domain-containing protein [Metabacillus malikii]|uniref:Nucleotidyltransferase n=1 Tax=Metabacillus malikii TaxID=1504265 RepID=A0ABT9ZD85_9BACI|nr:nucleotidyltransferase domain-containing protein [Metabacillus malikii]MDQ0230204.1 putative nucleotidyltransferase [Metabacillus malikii]